MCLVLHSLVHLVGKGHETGKLFAAQGLIRLMEEWLSGVILFEKHKSEDRLSVNFLF